MSYCHHEDINWAPYVKLHLQLRLAKCKVISNMIFESIPILNKSWRIIREGHMNEGFEKEPLSFVWIPLKNENYFTIQLIFSTIYGSYCTF